MADSTPPSIAVLSETTDQDGVGGEGGEEVKQSLESLLSRSDSASVDEDGDEGESSTLAVPSTSQGKSRDTSRKGRKISLNVKVWITRWDASGVGRGVTLEKEEQDKLQLCVVFLTS